ncbi:hypothetical protein F4821DRAFT_265253 [Hypoxylon rubiginosum]|uniref:Uncharacterized protein n=1 Tax=Hypoxylon rubiginosum TaxID=110542 RepID=A0ACC0CKY9_9PEZI|nr:hypothetical protein F4821DRAFT_265253 [Hypoxylon rubiginosum]
MKLLVAILSSCLWPLATGHPAPQALDKFKLGHTIDTVPVLHNGTPVPRVTRFTALAAAAVAAAVAARDSNATFALAPNANFTSASAKPQAIRCTAGGSTYVDTTVPESAPASDCFAVADGISNGSMGFWNYTKADWAHRNETGFKMLASSGACAFGVDVQSLAADTVPIGTEDAAVVIREAVKRFGSGNGTAMAAGANGTCPGTDAASGTPKLGAAGAFQCGVGPSTIVNWGLYHAA